MTYNVHPYPMFTTYFDSAQNRTMYQQSGYSPGMSVQQLWMGQILAAMVASPAILLDPEEQVDYAIKLVRLAYSKMPPG